SWPKPAPPASRRRSESGFSASLRIWPVQRMENVKQVMAEWRPKRLERLPISDQSRRMQTGSVDGYLNRKLLRSAPNHNVVSSGPGVGEVEITLIVRRGAVN